MPSGEANISLPNGRATGMDLGCKSVTENNVGVTLFFFKKEQKPQDD
jgi:hypothetical protein